MGVSRWLSGKEPICQCRSHRRCELIPVGKILEEETATHSAILPVAEEPPDSLQSVCGVAESDMTMTEHDDDV